MKNRRLAYAALFAASLVLAELVGYLDLQSAEVTAAIVAERDAEVADLRALLAKPLQCDATVSMRGAGEPWRGPYCYVRPENR